MSDLVTRDFIHPAADGYPLSMRLIAHPAPTSAVLVSSGTGFPKRFYGGSRGGWRVGPGS